jgi:hypothetical protein
MDDPLPLLSESQKLKEVYLKSDIPASKKCLGFSLALVTILLMQVQNQLIKWNYEWNRATGQECLYYQNLMMLPLFYSVMRFYKKDPMAVPKDLRLVLAARASMGSLMEICLVISFQYISFS